METVAQQRVREEHSNIYNKRWDLKKIINTQYFDLLDELSRNLMLTQYQIMKAYENVLEMRLNNWKD